MGKCFYLKEGKQSNSLMKSMGGTVYPELARSPSLLNSAGTVRCTGSMLTLVSTCIKRHAQ